MADDEGSGSKDTKAGKFTKVNKLSKLTKEPKEGFIKHGKLPKQGKLSKKGKFATEEPTLPPVELPNDNLLRVNVITHAPAHDDTFWNAWKNGAEIASIGSNTLLWNAVGYDAYAAVKALNESCISDDAIVVTVPYAEGSESYTIMDDAIKDCIKQGKPIFTTNTDTYHNEDVYAYVGSSNYDMGVKCAKSILFSNNIDVISGRVSAPAVSSIMQNSTVRLQLYWDAKDMLNDGLRLRMEGLNSTLTQYDVTLDTFLPTGNKDCPCVQKYPDIVTLEESEGLRVTIDGTDYDYPPEYGLGSCTAHDKNLIPNCNGKNAPSWCSDGWCYVDPENCHERISRSVGGEYVWTDFEGSELPYSYGTCGNTNDYENWWLGGDNAPMMENLFEKYSKTEDLLTIVFSSNYASKFTPSVFICGEEDFNMPGIPQYGQSPFMQGLTAVSSAKAAALGLANNRTWEAAKGNTASMASSESVSVDKVIAKAQLSLYGQAVVTMLQSYYVTRGITWDIWHDAKFDPDWIMQHPPLEYIGKPSAHLNVPEICTKNEGTRTCNTDFLLWECDDENPCNAKKFCKTDDVKGPYPNYADKCKKTETFFEPGMCKEINATMKSVHDNQKNLCVGHSYTLWEGIYNHIILAEKLVEITSLDSFDLGQTETGKIFTAVIRNALNYLASTGKKITVKCHFGSPPSASFTNENTTKILETITQGFPIPSSLEVWVGTYRKSINTWNHGKIIVIDGKELITGGSNYYTDHYLREDPVHDVSMRVSGGAAVTAHRFSEKIWKTSCESWGIGMDHMEISWKLRDGSVHISDFIDTCAPEYSRFVEDGILDVDDDVRPKTGASIIPAARLSHIGEDISGGSHTSDLAMLALMETAVESVKFSQQDMLPILVGANIGVLGITINPGFGGYTYLGGITSTPFDDTWRIIGGIAKAISRNVDVYIMTSAPCAFGAQHPDATAVWGMNPCPVDGTPGPGFDYWEKAYFNNPLWGKWPKPRSTDMDPNHISDGVPHRRRLQSKNNNSTLDTEKDHRAYGYGWSQQNIADWIFAYYMLNKDARPKNLSTNLTMTADEIADHICERAHIGHIRLNANETTYKRGAFKGGQVGNHAKIVMADDRAFYMGSDNAYGSGLAEFGLVVDDVSRASELNDRYWEPLWTQALGTKESGTISGSSRLGGGCLWKERLPNRGPPWDNLHHGMCTTFSNSLQCKEYGCQWVRLDVPFLDCAPNPQTGKKICSWVREYCVGEREPNGSLCLQDDVCESGYCSWDKPYKCKDKLAIGEKCFEHEDCANGICEKWDLTFTCKGQQIENGDACFSDDACKSGRCDKFLKCGPLLEDGKTCFQDDDCKSEECTYLLTCGLSEQGENCLYDVDCAEELPCNWAFTCGKNKLNEECRVDTDCLSDRCDWSFKCSNKKRNGETCAFDNNCDIEHCNSLFTCGRRKHGETCLVGNDCDGDRHCNSRYQCGRLDDGYMCVSDSDCKSKRCNWGFRCERKRPKGSSCSRHSDCESNQCRGYWSWKCQ
uniref:PLD phosphodiesterase domain-containing protein n=1 Tax=Corethron hystrix TaxID=216773 RepID=A0A7S1B4E0_9STRA